MWLWSFKEPCGQVARWQEQIAEFDFEIIHRPGIKHGNADALSRANCKQCDMKDNTASVFSVQTEENIPGSEGVMPSLPDIWSVEEIRNCQYNDKDLRPIILHLQGQNKKPEMRTLDGITLAQRSFWNQLNSLTLRKGVLYRQLDGHKIDDLQLVIPREKRKAVLQYVHENILSGHLGIQRTQERVRSRFYWPGWRADVEIYCKECTVCEERKQPTKTRCAPLVTNRSGFTMEKIAMDILGPLPTSALGNKYILVISDYFSKWTEAYALADHKAVTIAGVLVNEFITRFGVPLSIHTDQGRDFESKLIKEICQLLGIEKIRTSPYHPQSDGQVERFNRTLLEMLSKVVNAEQRDWDRQSPNVMIAYRTSVNSSTGYTPAMLMLGRGQITS